MKKADKRKLARELYEKLTALGIKMKVEGNWTKMDGGPIPTELLMQSGQCGDELAEVVREKSGRFMKKRNHTSGAFTLSSNTTGKQLPCMDPVSNPPFHSCL